jgi:putative membrane protein
MQKCKIVVSICALCTVGLAPAGALAQTVSAQATNAQARALSEKDAEFVRDAASDGMAEVELGRLAVQKATQPEIKSFGQMLVDDHEKAYAELKALAAQKTIALPGEPKPAQKAERARLEQLAGAAFDAAFANTMKADHLKAVDLFSKQAASGADPDVKTWAGQKLPTLQAHLAKAEELAAKTGTTPQDE